MCPSQTPAVTSSGQRGTAARAPVVQDRPHGSTLHLVADNTVDLQGAARGGAHDPSPRRREQPTLLFIKSFPSARSSSSCVS